MNPVTLILVYVIIWWLVFFMALPFGVKAQYEEGGDIIPGSVPSAPQHPKIGKKILWSGLIALIITGILYGIIALDWLSLRG